MKTKTLIVAVLLALTLQMVQAENQLTPPSVEWQKKGYTYVVAAEYDYACNFFFGWSVHGIVTGPDGFVYEYDSPDFSYDSTVFERDLDVQWKEAVKALEDATK